LSTILSEQVAENMSIVTAVIHGAGSSSWGCYIKEMLGESLAPQAGPRTECSLSPRPGLGAGRSPTPNPPSQPLQWASLSPPAVAGLNAASADQCDKVVQRTHCRGYPSGARRPPDGTRFEWRIRCVFSSAGPGRPRLRFAPSGACQCRQRCFLLGTADRVVTRFFFFFSFFFFFFFFCFFFLFFLLFFGLQP